MAARSLSTTISAQAPPRCAPGEQIEEREIGVADDAALVDLGDADRRIVEEARQALRGIARARPFARAAAPASATAGACPRIEVDAMDDAHRHDPASLARRSRSKVSVIAAAWACGRRAAVRRLRRRYRSATVRHLRLRHVEAEPSRERGVDIGDAAVGDGREEAGRRVVEIADDVLQMREGLFLPRGRR